MAFLDIFVGVPQSKYAGAAVLLSLLGVSLAILFGRDPLPVSQKFAFVLLIFLVSLPGLLLTLFQLTCMVTGTQRGAWWCGVYSWFVSILVILYSILLVVVAVMSLADTGKVLEDLARADSEAFEVMKAQANDDAAKYFSGAGGVPSLTQEAPVQKFEDQMDTFAIQGEASVPAPIGIEPFDDKEDEFESYNEAFTDAPEAQPKPKPTTP